MAALTLDDFHTAQDRVRKHIHCTPVLTCSALDEMAGCSLHFKCELFQKTGSFKARGALNAVLSLSDAEAARGVVTHSSGNHAAAVAFAARKRGIRAIVVMPDNAPLVKREAVAGYGADIRVCESTNAAREAAAKRVVEETGAVFIHPSNDPRVAAGQGTAGVELVEQTADIGGLDAVIVPVGGGGLISGISTAVKALSPETLVIGAEPAAADDAARSLARGELCGHDDPPSTMADGLRTTLGSVTWPIVRDRVDRILTVPESAIARALGLVIARMKLAIEPSAAVGVAVALSDEFAEMRRRRGLRRVGVILCGGNADIGRIAALVEGAGVE